jgi:hypothetical protein
MRAQGSVEIEQGVQGGLFREIPVDLDGSARREARGGWQGPKDLVVALNHGRLLGGE